MKATLGALAFFLALAGAAPFQASAQSRGGGVLETRLAIYELAASRDLVTIHVNLKGKKSFSAKGAAASFKVVNANGQVIDQSKLLAADGATLQARGPFKMGAGTKLVATIKFNGQPTERLTWTLR